MGLLGRRVPSFAIIGLIVAILATIAALFLARAQSQSNSWAQHSLRVQVMLSNLTDHVRAIESDHRGYVLSRSPGMKRDMLKMIGDLEPQLAQLATEVGDNPEQLASIAELRHAIAKKVNFALEGIASVEAGRDAEETARIETGEGARRMKAALAVIARMMDVEKQLLIQRQDQTDQLVLGLGFALVAAVLLVLVAAATVISDARRREADIVGARDAAIAAEMAMREQIAARERAEDQIRQMQRMESIGRLTGGIAHDFNNMLAIVIGSLDLAKRRLNDAAKLGRYIDNAYEGAERAAALTARLLAFSRQQPLAPHTLDVNKLVAGMSELLQRTMGEEYMIETVLAGGLWRTYIDPGQLENAILNLAVNARDAMENGGRVTIETANAYLDDDYARLHSDVNPGQYVMLSVTDTGTGMTPDIIAKAFDPFFTTKAVGKGTGLGLSQIYGFLKQTGGHAAIYSEPGQGSTVKLYMPRHHGEAVDVRSPEPIGATEVPRARDRETILVVEDEPRVRQFSIDALRELGYIVVSAANGADALQALRDQPGVDILFTDIVMPAMNGRQLADAAVGIQPDIKVLFTTGYTRNAVVHNGMLDAGVAFLPKPFSVTQLGTKIRQVLDGGGANRPV